MDDGAPRDEQPAARFHSTGKVEHVDDLLSRYVGKVYGMIDLMVANQADAEDLTQGVLVRAGRAPARARHLPSWLQGSWLTDAQWHDQIISGRGMKPCSLAVQGTHRGCTGTVSAPAPVRALARTSAPRMESLEVG